MAQLTVHKGRRHLFDYRIDKPETVIGRGQDVDVGLTSEAVSRRHATIRVAGGRYIAEDVSSNGMFVNGSLTTRRSLADGDRLEIAQYVLTFNCHADERPPAPAAAAAAGAVDKAPAQAGPGEAGYDLEPVTRLPFGTVQPDVALEPEVARRKRRAATHPGHPDYAKRTAFLSAENLQRLRDAVALKRSAHIAFMAGGTRHEFALEAAEHYVGWDEDCDVRLPGRRWFARCAACIWLRETGEHQIDAESVWRAVRVGGAKTRAWVLQDGDVIEIGGVELHYHEAVG